jgi:signal transduction histidine kinase
MNARFAMGIRGRFLTVVVGGVILPIGIAGLWLARGTRHSGEALLRSRAEGSLADAAKAIGYRWVDERSALLGLAENPAVISGLSDGHDLRASGGAKALAALDQAWTALDGVADAVTFRDSSGVARGQLDRQPTANYVGLRVRLPIYAAHSATQVGSLEARLRLVALLPPGFWWAGIGGSVPALFEPGSSTSLLPVPMRAQLLDADAFEWSGEQWVVTRRSIDEPRMQLVLAAPTGAFVKPFAAAARQGSIALAIAFVFALILATLLTRRITHPLLRLSEASEAVARGEMERRVATDGPPEIRRLARAFNAMTESLRNTLAQLSHREALAAVGEFAASLAHEVRNPLTSVRLDLERARERLGDTARADALMGQALHQIDRLESVVSGSLRIARSGQLKLEPLDLRRPLDAAVHAAQPAFDSRHATLVRAPELTEPVCINGNPGALEQAFLNLLINAAESLASGKCAEIGVMHTPDAIVVRIRDEGAGIPPDQLSRVLDPFFTTKESGTGLGLPVARRVVEAHGGSLLIDSIVGVGTTVEVRLPRKSIRDRNGS